MTSTWAEAYRRLLDKKARLQRLYDAARDAAEADAAAAAEAEAEAHLWRNLVWLAPYSGRNGIRGDRLQYQPRVPAQRRPTERVPR